MELGKIKTIDSLKRSYICPQCGSEGAFISFANWRTEDLENGTCSKCDFKDTISEFRKSTLEILALARGRLLGAYCAIAMGLAGVDSLLREMSAVFDPEDNAMAERVRTREAHGWPMGVLDKLDLMTDLIKDRLCDIEGRRVNTK